MFAHELFDFVPTPHPSDGHPVGDLDPFSDPLFDSYIDSSHLDQSFCSDFSCCGQNLPDLHRLLEHFEDEHVLPLPNDSRPLFSSPVYAQPRSAASGPCASYILSYPQPDPPLQPVTHPISASGPRTLPTLDFSRIPPVPDLTHSPLSPSPSSSSTTSAYSSPSPREPICLPPSLFHVQPSLPCTPPPSSRPDHARVRYTLGADTDVDIDMDDDAKEASSGSESESDDEQHAPPPRPPISTSSKPSRSRYGNASACPSAGPHRSAKRCSAARMDCSPAAAAAAATARCRSRAHTPERVAPPAAVAPAPSPKRRDGREKAFKCPHPGCTKSYLNPNGLKYHLEKGTCTNADVCPRQPLPASVSLPIPIPIANVSAIKARDAEFQDPTPASVPASVEASGAADAMGPHADVAGQEAAP